MEHISLASPEPLHHSKLDEMVQIEAIAIEEGVWTDSLGRTLKYTPEVLANSFRSCIGKPIILPHTDGKDDMRKVIGLTTEAWCAKHEGKEAIFYRGLISNEDAGLLVMSGDLTGNSVEADFTADMGTHPPTLTALNISAVCLTNRPACSRCLVSGSKRTNMIKLEGEKTQLSTSEEKPIDPEEALAKIRTVFNEAYPMAKTKTWGDMSKEEKMGACSIFFKNSGYPIPEKFPKKTKDEATGAVEWEFPPGYPEDLKNEILGLENKVVSLSAEVQNLKNEVTKRDTEEVNRLVNEIKAIDADFTQEGVVKMEKCPCKQKVILTAYLDNLIRLKPKFSVGATVQPTDVERLDKISMEAFGMPLSALEKQLSLSEKR